MTKRAPVETKVVAATGSAAGGTAVSAFLVWLLGVLVWGAPNDADHAAKAVLAVPAPVSVLLALAVTSAFTWAGGYLARHTKREDAGLTVPELCLLVIAACVVVLTVVALTR